MAGTTQTQPSIGNRQGFTLVEMLVSVTLVLLMMTMFTGIFQVATDSVTKQRGIAQNDQRARALVTTLKADLAKRTFRYVLPFYPTESSGSSPTGFGDRAGYIYISTNDPSSGQDDLFQFTVNVKLSQEETDDTPYFGAAKLMYDLQAAPAFLDTPRRTALRFNPNQPDADDGNLHANEVAASSAAEISYFIRNGGLYRRVMLLREPLPVAGEDLAIQPVSTVSGNSYTGTLPPGGAGVSDFGGIFAVVNSPLNINHVDSGVTEHFALATGETAPAAWNVTATNDFWLHFDYAATPTLQTVAPFLPTGAAFVGIDALDNTQAAALGNPGNRFGFNAVTGLSREHDNATATRRFIGHFTQAETSHPDFNWPAAACRNATLDSVDVPNAASAFDAINTGPIIGNGNPMDIVGTPLTLNPQTGVITQFQGSTGRGGNRRVEDLLLANVHSFRVEIWDDRLERYVTPANNSQTQILDAGGNLQVTAGDYHLSRRLNGAYGPLGPAGGAASPTLNRVFGTWHPTAFFDYNGNGTQQNFEASPPFVPYRYYPPRSSDGPYVVGGAGAMLPPTYPAGPGPMPAGMTSPYLEYDSETGNNQQNKGYWVGSDFSDIDPMNWNYHTYNAGDVVFAAVRDVAPFNDTFEWTDNIPPTAFHIAYRCVSAGYAADPTAYGASGQPPWPRVPGQKTTEALNLAAVGTPAIWESLDNRRPLRSLKVTVQFFDQTTEKLRQLSLVLPLTTDR